MTVGRLRAGETHPQERPDCFFPRRHRRRPRRKLTFERHGSPEGHTRPTPVRPSRSFQCALWAAENCRTTADKHIGTDILTVVDVALVLRAARRASGLTQTQVATRAHTSQAALAAYETGQKSPRIDTVERLAAAMGGSLRFHISLSDIDDADERPISALSREERRSLWLHRAIAAKIQAAPEAARALAYSNLATMRAGDARDRGRPWHDEWSALLDGTLEMLLVQLGSTSMHASQLRQTTPFAGLLTPKERWAVYRSFGTLDEARTA